jgi:hypothetical protein
MRNFPILLVLLGNVVSCSFNKMYVDELTDPEWKYDNGSIEIWKPNNNDLEDKNVRAIVKASLSKRFPISDTAGTYYFHWSKWNTEGSGQSTLLLPQYQSTSGNVGGIKYSGTTTGGVQAIPYSYSYNIKQFNFELYRKSDVEKFLADTTFKPQMVWRGFCSIEQNLFPKLEAVFYDSCLVSFPGKRQGEIILGNGEISSNEESERQKRWKNGY